MFTGIIENEGTVVEKKSRGGQIRFTFRFKRKVKEIKVGDSIAVDGVCLTAVKINPQYFSVDAVKETLEATTLGDLERGSKVNLERSLKAGDRLGGHFVTGHIDGCGKIIKIERRKKNTTLFIQAPAAIIAMLAPKGSVALDGISLTVQKVHRRLFEIAVIPHTLKETTLGIKGVGSKLNIEIDIVARYLKACFKKPAKKVISSKVILKALLKQGF